MRSRIIVMLRVQLKRINRTAIEKIITIIRIQLSKLIKRNTRMSHIDQSMDKIRVPIKYTNMIKKGQILLSISIMI